MKRFLRLFLPIVLCTAVPAARAADGPRPPLISPSLPEVAYAPASLPGLPPAVGVERASQALERAQRALEAAEAGTVAAKERRAAAKAAEKTARREVSAAHDRLEDARDALATAERNWRKHVESVTAAESRLASSSSRQDSPEERERLRGNLRAALALRNASAVAISAATTDLRAAENGLEEAQGRLEEAEKAREAAEAAVANAKTREEEAEETLEDREDAFRAAQKAFRAAEKEAERLEKARKEAEIAAEKARIAAEKAAEKARLAKEERLAKEAKKAEKARLEEEARLAKERAAEEARKGRERAEKKALREKARAEREARRLAEERAAEEARLANEKAEEKIRLWAEKERLKEEKEAKKAAEAAEKARLAEEARLERERLAEEARLAREAERAEKIRLAEEKAAEKERLKEEKEAEKARRKAEKEEEKARLAEEKRLAEEAEEAERARLEAEEATEAARLAEEAATPREVALLPPRGAQVELSIPIPVIALKGAFGTVSLPPQSLFRLMGNGDGTFTVFTTAHDILAGKLVDPPVLPANGDGTESIRLDKVLDLSFRAADFASPLPGEAAWRLTSGDILHGTWVRGEDAVSGPSAPAVPLFAARAADAADGICPRRGADGRWTSKAYTVRLAANGELLDIPSAKLDAAAVGPLPPMILPAGPSVRLDEIECAGGAFPLGRQGGEGNADETPMVDIELAPFFLASTPVTKAQFRAFAEDTRYVTAAERIPGQPTWKNPGFPQGDDEPVVAVTWRDAAAYCNWRSRKARLKPAYDIREGGLKIRFDPTSDGYRLPLEAEWEWAASWGKTVMPFPWSTMEADEDWMDEAVAVGRANFAPATLALDPWPTTNPVKAFPPTGMGFYDLAGNVWEWMGDVYAEDAYRIGYRTGDIASLLNPPEGATRVRRSMRGGSYANPLPFLRCTARGYGYEQMSAPRVGFRVARSAPADGR